MKYRKKPVVINAIEWTGSNKKEIDSFVPSDRHYYQDDKDLIITTLEGPHFANIGDMIIQGVRGDDFYPCKSDIFKKSYDKV